MRIAAVDVGSNAIRLATRRLSSTGVTQGSTFRRYGLRLGADVFSQGAISGHKEADLLRLFHDIAARLDRGRVDRYRAVATSAMRDARNGEQVVRRIERETGIAVEIIDGEQELALARTILLRSLGSVPADALLVDLGGGSLELDRADRRSGLSMPLGTVRLVESYPEFRSPLPPEAVARLRARIREELRQHLRRQPAAPLAIGTGGNLAAMARLIPVRGCPLPAIEVRRLPDLVLELAELSPSQRARRYGLRRDRADLILPAALVVLAAVDVFRLNAFVVPGTGLRESILHSLVVSPTVDREARQVLVRFGQDPSQADRVMRGAEQLFELLAPLHGLWPAARGPLQAAVYLRGIGGLIDPARSATHTPYMIEALPDLSLDLAGRRVAAAAALASVGLPARPVRARLSDANRQVSDVLGAIVAVATELAERRSRRPLRADLLSNPLVIEAYSRIRPSRPCQQRLERALRRAVRFL